MKREGIIKDLETFLEELRNYREFRKQMKRRTFTSKALEQIADLRRTLVRKSGKYKYLIAEITGIENVSIFMNNKEFPTDIWSVGLLGNPVTRTPTALDYCLDSVGQAIGKLEDDIKMGKRDTQTGEILTKADISGSEPTEALTAKANWKDIKTEYGVTKRSFGKRINFVKDPFKRAVIYRDVEQAFILERSGFSKPAVILAGGVIEELLRLYLKHKKITPTNDSFDGYIQTCEQNGLLKAGVSRLTDSARHFRNLVHLSREETKRHTTSKSAAIGAVSSIFTIANDF
ncbi:MAG: hypothetical protein GH158_04460 [Dehalococcoidia bacterium]|nr:hypothetical protein [Dehalococcoidia bacterium]